jgi:hypothetical protein
MESGTPDKNTKTHRVGTSLVRWLLKKTVILNF